MKAVTGRQTSREADAIAKRVVEMLSNRGRLDQPFFTVETLAAKLSLTPRTVRAMLQKGVIPSYKIEGARRIAPQDVEKYLAVCRDEGFEQAQAA